MIIMNVEEAINEYKKKFGGFHISYLWVHLKKQL